MFTKNAFLTVEEWGSSVNHKFLSSQATGNLDFDPDLFVPSDNHYDTSYGAYNRDEGFEGENEKKMENYGQYENQHFDIPVEQPDFVWYEETTGTSLTIISTTIAPTTG